MSQLLDWRLVRETQVGYRGSAIFDLQVSRSGAELANCATYGSTEKESIALCRYAISVSVKVVRFKFGVLRTVDGNCVPRKRGFAMIPRRKSWYRKAPARSEGLSRFCGTAR